ncbi:CPBP family intramembrane metalloprotease [Alcaligenaceae bacterium LF4-65]|uniref:CPBP family intramembrane metalloprotease n=1 Tax=Zwartia hollandica TaxID=324606 RepID=A0A953N8L3_9BURK|nr:CPBP family glutamic-type intramembrane protease [Zwartia hollandica]MBZ1349613.1 CPBP family intramembrane metalloprotease [Zwartia hollandica]
MIEQSRVTGVLPFREELVHCLRFIRRPTLTRAFANRSAGARGGGAWHADWWPGISVKRLLAWAALLWFVNIVLLGPLVLGVFELSGASHRIDVHNLPWFQALLWAPIVEELLFRFGLRRPVHALWLVPVLILVFLNGMQWWAGSLLGLSVLVLWWLARWDVMPSVWSWSWLRAYCKVFPWVMHASVVAFAALHLHNFKFEQMAWWMMVVLVLPQWVTGLVLAWMRVERGIGAAILLHGLFNAGPLAVAWVALQFANAAS